MEIRLDILILAFVLGTCFMFFIYALFLKPKMADTSELKNNNLYGNRGFYSNSETKITIKGLEEAHIKCKTNNLDLNIKF